MKEEAQFCSSICSGSLVTLKYISFLLPAMGMVSEILSREFTKTHLWIYGDGGFIICYCYSCIPCLGASYVCNGIESFPRIILCIAYFIDRRPSAIKVFNWLTTLWRGNIRFTPATLFAIGFVSLFISGGLTGIFLGNSTLDIHLHDTMFVVAHFHIVMGVASMFGMFAGIYHWFPKMFGRYLNNTLGLYSFLGNNDRRLSYFLANAL